MSEKLVNAATEFRDKIPELEGLLIGNVEGKQLWADTLKDLNHEFIFSSAHVAYLATKKLSKAIEKKNVESIEIEIDGGYATVIISKKAMVVGFFGKDARTQLGIIKKNLEIFTKSIDKLV
jgi:predicted regulator of Ras-like GTPase activity (Roadblock/LC7/MglB family)